MTSEQSKTGSKTKEEIYIKLLQLRKLVTNLNTPELDSKEHETVINTLKTVDASRKCFRLISSVPVEQTVKEALPQLESNRDKLDELIERDSGITRSCKY